MTLAELHAAAEVKALAAETKVAIEENALADAQAFAKEHHQSMGSDYWKALHQARLKAQTARALAVAITEIMGEFGNEANEPLANGCDGTRPGYAPDTSLAARSQSTA
ncbi:MULTISPECIES: hypothetical protein [unclassified Mesorhizobium]|uniref:hypothetical protein n=1 Tax=unclassified Mesorhizobium TaxID=325217 RepID=UPI003334F915